MTFNTTPRFHLSPTLWAAPYCCRHQEHHMSRWHFPPQTECRWCFFFVHPHPGRNHGRWNGGGTVRVFEGTVKCNKLLKHPGCITRLFMGLRIWFIRVFSFGRDKLLDLKISGFSPYLGQKLKKVSNHHLVQQRRIFSLTYHWIKPR